MGSCRSFCGFNAAKFIGEVLDSDEELVADSESDEDSEDEDDVEDDEDDGDGEDEDEDELEVLDSERFLFLSTI